MIITLNTNAKIQTFQNDLLVPIQAYDVIVLKIVTLPNSADLYMVTQHNVIIIMSLIVSM